MLWFAHDGVSAYPAAKAAESSLTNGARLELAEQFTLVIGVYVGTVETNISAGHDGHNDDPHVVADAALDDVEACRLEVLVEA